MVSKVLQKEMLTFGKAMIANELPAGLKKLLQRESDRDPLIRKQFQITKSDRLIINKYSQHCNLYLKSKVFGTQHKTSACGKPETWQAGLGVPMHIQMSLILLSMQYIIMSVS